MTYTKNIDGFSLSSESAVFKFESNVMPKEDAGFLMVSANNTIPVPEIIPSDRILLPVDEGIAITSDAQYETGEFDCNCIKGNFCSRQGTMSMIIIERKQKFLLIALKNGLYAGYILERNNNLYHLSMYCSKESDVYYSIFDTLTEACKAYRKLKGDRFVTLEEKIKLLPEAQKLIGGMFWVWNNNYDEVMYSDKDTNISPAVGEDLLKIAKDLHSCGVDNAMFGIFFNDDSKYTKDLYENFGYICTQYDNYNDVLNPELLSIVPNNRVKNCDYTARRMKDYPDGIIVTKEGNLAGAWALKGFDGKFHSQNTLCPQIAHLRMNEEIPKILNEYPYYKGRFIDVFGGGVQECYSKDHPLTKEECLQVKRDAFDSLNSLGLIAGTEDGFDEILNSLFYTEGLHSPVYFRNHDSGRKHAHMYSKEREEHIKKHMLNCECRVPLWHLVYHECSLAFPYWGDSTASSIEIIKDKTLYACLYGCPPLYSFFVKDYSILKDSILYSYKIIESVLKYTATLPMTSYEVLSSDFKLQRTVFGGKYEVVANFSDNECEYNGKTILPKDFIFSEI